MRRAAGALLGTAKRAYATALAPQAPHSQEIIEVPAEVAALVSSRTMSMVELPAELEAALADALKTSGGMRLLRRRTAALTEELKKRSRSRSRGGVHSEEVLAGPALPERRAKRPRVQVVEWRRQKQMLESGGPLSLRDTLASISAVPDSDNEGDADEPGAAAPAARRAPPLRKGKSAQPPEDTDPAAEMPTPRGARARRDTAASAAPPVKRVEYDSGQVAAYAAARMPGCYAAVARVLDELRLRLPDFEPRSMLDFGAGPGTAIWAAREIWEGQPSDVLAVEPSLAMQEAQKRRGRPQADGLSRQYDLVVATYVLGELAGAKESAAAVTALWARTEGALVLVEPGTPAGSAAVREARAQILAEEARCAEAGGVAAGAHVVAPCPHDGACPMDGTGSWCHFAQRFLRSGLGVGAKMRPGGGRARTYQDERFSYVVLRRAPRPPPQADGDSDDEEEAEEEEEDWNSLEEMWRSRDAPALAAATAAATGWARIVRPPRKRSRHVILDLCTAARPAHGSGGEHTDVRPERGELVQQVVAAADKRAWLGPAGYRLARKARWGDLWPRWYEERAITVKGSRDGE
ncbi:hypothetical protein WJX81_003461 [Elliptochloris bilobata]|uniref:Mitochondrial small ribosomal subunit Rsm22 n=1 Tax=Elliptochloris bilobata TaxID=381761 RepID=A0AAW1SBY0_9CHLO